MYSILNKKWLCFKTIHTPSPCVIAVKVTVTRHSPLLPVLLVVAACSCCCCPPHAVAFSNVQLCCTLCTFGFLGHCSHHTSAPAASPCRCHGECSSLRHRRVPVLQSRLSRRVHDPQVKLAPAPAPHAGFILSSSLDARLISSA